jgi:hypothetical protein
MKTKEKNLWLMRKHKPRKIFSSHSQLIVKYSTNICKFSMNTISLKLYYSIDKNKKFENFYILFSWELKYCHKNIQ